MERTLGGVRVGQPAPLGTGPSNPLEPPRAGRPRRPLMQPHLPLEELVTDALARSPHVNERRLYFEAGEGRVVLRGTVGSYYQKQMAQEALRCLEGLAEIENALEVAW